MIMITMISAAAAALEIAELFLVNIKLENGAINYLSIVNTFDGSKSFGFCTFDPKEPNMGSAID